MGVESYFQKRLSGKGGGSGSVLGEQHQGGTSRPAEPLSLRTVRALGEVHLRASPDVLPGRLSLRTAVPSSQATGLRPQQRMQGHLLGLVPLPVVLCVQMLQHPRRVQGDFEKSEESRAQQGSARVVQEEDWGGTKLMTFTVKRKNILLIHYAYLVVRLRLVSIDL